MTYSSFDGMLGQSDILEPEVAIDGRPETVKGQMVSDNYHQVLALPAGIAAPVLWTSCGEPLLRNLKRPRLNGGTVAEPNIV